MSDDLKPPNMVILQLSNTRHYGNSSHSFGHSKFSKSDVYFTVTAYCILDAIWQKCVPVLRFHKMQSGKHRPAHPSRPHQTLNLPTTESSVSFENFILIQ